LFRFEVFVTVEAFGMVRRATREQGAEEHEGYAEYDEEESEMAPE
jgi:hypothetical protein